MSEEVKVCKVLGDFAGYKLYEIEKHQIYVVYYDSYKCAVCYDLNTANVLFAALTHQEVTK
jgi:hypothetical protein